MFVFVLCTQGNPISKELADFRLYIIAHTSICLRVLNDEPVSDAERCQAWLQYPEKDAFKSAAARDALAVPISSALAEAYACVCCRDVRVCALFGVTTAAQRDRLGGGQQRRRSAGRSGGVA